MNPERRVVCSTQSQVGLDVFHAMHRDMVVRIQLEGRESQNRLIRIKTETHTALLQLIRTQAYIDTHFPGAILIQQVGIRIILAQPTFYARTKRCLLPVFLFDHLRLIAQTYRILCDTRPDRVEHQSVLDKLQKFRRQLDASIRRGRGLQ